MKDIGIFFAEGYEEIEALTVVDILRRAGLPVLMVSVADQSFVTGSHHISVEMDAKLKDVDFEQIDMIVLPGGQPGTRNLEACDILMKQLDKFFSEKRYISAICAAPTILGHRGMLQNRKACCYPGLEDQLKGAIVKEDLVVTDEFLTTGKGMGAAIAFACAIIERYQGKAAAEKMKKTIVYEF